MDKSKQLPTEAAESEITPIQYWGTLAFTILGMLVTVLLMRNALQLPRITAAYFAMAVYALSFIAGIPAIRMIIRGRQKLAVQIAFFMVILVFGTTTFIYTGRAVTASFSLIMIAAIFISQLLPKELRHRYIFISVAALTIIWLTEWIDPSWRLTVDVNRLGPATAVIFALILGAIVIREAWSRNNIRSRFLTLSLGLTLLTSTVIAGVSVNALISAGQQEQQIAYDILRDQIRNTLGHQTIEGATQNDLILQNISQDAQDVAQQAAYIFENPDAFTSETYWEADSRMFVGPQGQYMNGTTDISSIFIPKTVEVNDNLKQQLERLAFLDMALAPVLEGNANAVAIYFVGKDEVTWFHPNINLATIVPPDYLATQDIFYTIGTPENNPERQVVWTPVYDDPGGQGLLVSAIAPVYADNTFMGIIGIDVSLAGLTKTIEVEDFGVGEGVYAFLLDDQGKALTLPERGYLDMLGRERIPDELGVDLAASARPEFASVINTMRGGETGTQSVFIGDQEFFVAYAPLATTNWYIASVADTREVLAPAATLETTVQELTNSLIYERITPIGIVLIVLVILAGVFFTNYLVNPIEQLTEGASRIGRGEWDTSLPQSELKEIEGLSRTLGSMAGQLKGTLATLEQRVADRTRNLELAAEVGRAVSEVRDLDVMLQDACNLILKEFDLYYVQVYLADPSQTRLDLEAGTGSVGAELIARGHNLPYDTASINGRAAVEKRSVVISDVSQSATFRQNPSLPETRGEMAVPLILANKVVGVLDMQSHAPGVLNEEVLPAFEALAGQLAVAIQNANLLAEAEQARAEVEKQARRLVRAGWNEHLDAIHKPEKIGFVFDQNDVVPLNESDESQVPEAGKSVSAPIAITGEQVGSLVVEVDESRKDKAAELVKVVAQQVAQQIENLRLLESAERYRLEAEEASRRLTREGWKSYIEEAGDKLSYVYDLTEVRLQNTSGDEVAEATGYTLPLKVRDETIGRLIVQGLDLHDEEAMGVANAVAERLGTHIESLRQFEETQRGQMELDKRAHQLAAVAEVSSVSSRELDIQKMLESVVYLTQRKFGLYHAHVFTYNNQTDTLKIAACGWKEGDEHEGTHGTTTIPMAQEQSLVARSARSRQAVIVNNVHNEPGWLPNPLLPDSNAELAVPLIIGDKILGVLDVQADHVDAFTEEDASIYSTLASQIATALQNAQSFAQAQQQAERESRLNVISQKIQSATTVEAVLQIAARELGHTLGAPLTIAQLGLKETASDN